MTFPDLSAAAACPVNDDGDWILPTGDPHLSVFEAFGAWEEIGLHERALAQLETVLRNPTASACAAQVARGYRMLVLVRMGRAAEARMESVRILQDGLALPFHDDALYWFERLGPR